MSCLCANCKDGKTPSKFLFSLSGITTTVMDCAFGDCESMNGDWELLRQENVSCVWKSDIYMGCGVGGHFAITVAGPDVVLAFQTQGLPPKFVSYRRAFSQWNCFGENEMTLDDLPSDMKCVGFPATIVLTGVK